MESVLSVSKLSTTKSVGSRRELHYLHVGLVANCVHTADGRLRHDKQFRRVGVGGVYWA